MMEDDVLGQDMDDETPVPIPEHTAEERSERACEILDEIGLISGSARITSGAILFVEDMQRRLADSRARKTGMFCSERQLEWLEAIYEKVS